MKNRLYIIVPCYNEEACIDECARQLLKKLEELEARGLCALDSRLLFPTRSG